MTSIRTILLLLLFLSLSQIKAQSPEVTIKDVTFQSAGTILAGTIYQPRQSYAAVVLVHGSGQATRMGELASIFANNGISVLTYDKRGVGESCGIYAGPEVGTNNVDKDNLNLLAGDASAAVDALRGYVKDMPIGLVGFSQAGWKIPIAATENPQVNFMVLFSGAVIPTLDQLIFQHHTGGKEDFWNTHTEAGVRSFMAEAREHITNNPEQYQLDNFVSTDPRDALSTLSIPGLWLFGEKDIQIPIGISVEVINALKAQGKPYEYCLFSQLGHNLVLTEFPQPIDIAIQWIKARNHNQPK